MSKLITTLDEYKLVVKRDKLSFIYFKNDKCSVCDSLFPQLKSIIDNWEEELFVIDCNLNPEIAAQNLVLSVPALKVFYNNLELISMLRFVELHKLKQEYYKIKQVLQA
jgi:thiol-disulfide isomerase/thioredoxin